MCIRDRHVSEFEPKQPQLEPKPMNGDSISLRHVRPGRTEPAVAAMLGNNPFSTYENSSGFSITVTTTDKYTFSLGTNASVTEEGGGPTVSAGPVTITP